MSQNFEMRLALSCVCIAALATLLDVHHVPDGHIALYFQGTNIQTRISGPGWHLTLFPLHTIHYLSFVPTKQHCDPSFNTSIDLICWKAFRPYSWWILQEIVEVVMQAKTYNPIATGDEELHRWLERAQDNAGCPHVKEQILVISANQGELVFLMKGWKTADNSSSSSTLERICPHDLAPANSRIQKHLALLAQKHAEYVSDWYCFLKGMMHDFPGLCSSKDVDGESLLVPNSENGLLPYVLATNRSSVAFFTLLEATVEHNEAVTKAILAEYPEFQDKLNDWL